MKFGGKNIMMKDIKQNFLIEQPILLIVMDESVLHNKLMYIEDSINNVSLSKSTKPLTPNSLISVKHPFKLSNSDIYVINVNVTTQYIKGKIFFVGRNRLFVSCHVERSETSVFNY